MRGSTNSGLLVFPFTINWGRRLWDGYQVLKV
jgi:hypothetical protein